MNVLANEVARQLDAAAAETAEDDSIRAMVVYCGRGPEQSLRASGHRVTHDFAGSPRHRVFGGMVMSVST
jgi:hypothetical protein